MERSFAGARWWKFDFHAHTPHSTDTPWHREGEGYGSLTPEAWLRRFMNGGLDCVAVTDHNGAGWVDRLEAEYGRLRFAPDATFRPLVLFPGVELSVNGGFHVLALFDPSAGSEAIDRLLARLGYEGQKGSADECTRASLVEVIEEIAALQGLAIPAHVDRAKGLLQTKPDAPRQCVGDASTIAQVLKSRNLFAMEALAPSPNLPQLYRDNKAEWTVVVGSDDHGRNGDPPPGSRFTWVKMGSPTLEGLKLALLDGSPLSVRRSDAVSTDPNEQASLVIDRLIIRDARYAGRGQDLVAGFSPWLTSIIGGRGAGKSTIVEMLRLALRREGELQGPLAERFRDFSQVAASRADTGVLQSNTEVLAEVWKDGARFRLRWRHDGEGAVIEEFRDGAWVNSTGDPSARFPVRVLSQKQVGSLAERPDGLLRLIDEAPAVGRADWDREWRETEAKFLRLRSEGRELTSRLSDERRIEGELDDARRQLAVFEAGDHRGLLQDYQRAKRQQRDIDERAADLERGEQQLREAATSMLPADVSDGSFNRDDAHQGEVLALTLEAAAAQEKIANELLTAADGLALYRRQWLERVALSAWAADVADVVRRYEALVEELARAGIRDPSGYGTLVQRIQLLEKQISDIESIRGNVDLLEADAQTTLRQLATLRLELSRRRSGFLRSIVGANEFVRMQVVPLGDSAAAAEPSLREGLGKKDGRLVDDILSEDGAKGILADIYRRSSDQIDRSEPLWRQVRGVCRQVREMKKQLASAATGGPLPERTEWFRRHLQGLLPEQIDRLQAWWPEDTLRVQYRRGGPREAFVSIEQGSPGQKSAAILAFLLSYGEEPLVLDQPEDDLDNQLISDLIVTQLRASKARRQVIVATHNPNIVVNGDAEMVIAMDFKAGQCRVEERCSGCLQEREVRRGICRVMEGGARAFEERYRRIKLDREATDV